MRAEGLIPWRRHRTTPRTLPRETPTEFPQGFDEFVDRFFGHQGGFLDAFSDSHRPSYGAVDFAEKKDRYVAKVDLPGTEEEDIDVEISGARLVIHAHRTDEEDQTRDGVRQIERSFGEVSRSIVLSEDVDPDKIEATFKKGVLTLIIPKSETARERARKININKD